MGDIHNVQPGPRPAYFQLSTTDTAGHAQVLFASYRDGRFVLFLVAGNLAQVMYILPAQSAADVPKVVSQRIIDVAGTTALPDKPAFDAAVLSPSHPWSPEEQAAVGQLLETSDVRLNPDPPVTVTTDAPGTTTTASDPHLIIPFVEGGASASPGSSDDSADGSGG